MSDQPTLTQTQIIRALADALSWFEREVSWGVKPAELRALTGRIGELYAAMITRGQMALATNQHGYDVVSADGERTSVKTITSSSHISFNLSTFSEIDRVIVLRVNVDPEAGVSIEELLDPAAGKARELFRERDGRLIFTPASLAEQRAEGLALTNLRINARASFGEDEIVRYENGAIRVLRNGLAQQLNVKAFLRPIAADIGVSTESEGGVRLTTQQLGANVIRVLNERYGDINARKRL